MEGGCVGWGWMGGWISGLMETSPCPTHWHGKNIYS